MMISESERLAICFVYTYNYISLQSVQLTGLEVTGTECLRDILTELQHRIIIFKRLSHSVYVCMCICVYTVHL